MTSAVLPSPHTQMQWLFDQLSARSPGSGALIGVAYEWTASEIRAAMEACATALWPTLAACPTGAPVVLKAPRSRPDAVVALLSIWRLGLVPVLSEADCTWTQDGTLVEPPILSPASPARTVQADETAKFEVLGQHWMLNGTPVSTPLPCARPGYVIGTSGTTGPSAPVLNHADGLQGTVTGLVERYHLSANSRALLFAPFGYDAALADLLPVLLAGGAAVCCDDGSWQRPSALAARIRSAGVTHAVVPPSVLRSVLPALEAADIRFKVLVSAGEPLEPALADRLTALAETVVNAYGPSEAAICVTTFEVGPEVAEKIDHGAVPASVPVGQPLPGVAVQVIDGAGTQVGPGVVARVMVRGASVAHGYLDPAGGTVRPERFQPQGPSSELCPPQVLDTGDIGLLSGNGDLVLVGRSDDETKLHGRRIRLTAIEAALRTLPDVADAVVAVHEDLLHCLWVSAPSDTTDRGSAHGAVAHVGPPAQVGALPPPVPSIWHRVATLPTTASDKIDRAAVLSQITALTGSHVSTVRPVTESSLWSDGDAVGAVVERLWRRHTSSPGELDEDFFAVGGDSLRAMELLDDIETETGRYIDLADFLEAPTMRHLVTLLRTCELASSRPKPAGEEMR